MTKQAKTITGLLAAIAVVGSVAVAPVASGATARRATATTTVSSRHTQRGVVITTSRGFALYTFTGRSCSSACTRVWVPLAAKGRLLAAARSGVEQRLLGRARRGRGFQVTYNHHPLFLFRGDSKPGQISGEGKHQFGGYWYVVGPRGAILKPRSSSLCGGVVCGY